MRVINKSRKIIAIGREPFLPGTNMELPEGMEKHPVIIDYLKRGMIAEEGSGIAPSCVTDTISDVERKKIAEDAIAQYKAAQIAAGDESARREEERKAVKGMSKDGLITKAIGMGLEVNDSDTAPVLRERIIAALSE